MHKYIYIALYKPFGTLCQFTGEAGDKTLSEFGLPEEVYAAGRLDKDSEGLLLLTNDGIFNQKITNPKSNKEKTYWVQVENIPSEDSLAKLRSGIRIKDYITKKSKVTIIEAPLIPQRDPPIRQRKSIPTCWLELTITEGKNRQVRRMTAAIGHPTLRLIRSQIGKLTLETLQPGKWREVTQQEILK